MSMWSIASSMDRARASSSAPFPATVNAQRYDVRNGQVEVKRVGEA